MIKFIILQIYLTLTISYFIIYIYSFRFNNKNIHPLIIIIILIIILINSSWRLRIYFNDHWISFIIFLIIIGGIIIIFLYFTRFINNINLSINWNFYKNLIIKLFITLLLIFIFIYLIKINYWINNFNEINNLNKINNNQFEKFIYIYIYPKNFITFLSIIYLFLSITIIVKICINKKITLRKIN